MPGRAYSDAYFSPGRGAADVVIGFIDRTEQTLDVAVYSVTHDDIAAALIRAHQRGVKVRVLMDKAQAGNRYADDEKLLEAGVDVRRDRVSGLMHHKFAICDANMPNKYAVLTGSFNWTASADERNAENFVVLRKKGDVRNFQGEFDNIWRLNAPD